MANLSTLSLAPLLIVTLAGCAQNPTENAASSTDSAASAPTAMTDRMAMMDKHMQAMSAMHDRVGRARTPEERQALMAEHMKLMQDGMTMMGGMGPGGMGMGMGMADMKGAVGTTADLAVRQQMMEKHMEMMRSMMQMMMDRMPAQPPVTK
jgi:hypothetical protein